jgi:hypothetical protein
MLAITFHQCTINYLFIIYTTITKFHESFVLSVVNNLNRLYLTLLDFVYTGS